MALLGFTRADAGTRSAAAGPAIEVVAVHPVVRERFVCLDDPGELRAGPEDLLETDCLVVRLAAGPARNWPRFYDGEGWENEDWYGWDQPLLAPFDGVVETVYESRAVNRPGESGSGEPGRIVFRRADGVRVEYRQVMRIHVAPGEPVTAGQPVARLGNNGAAAMPAVRIAAWRGGTPLQVRFDPRATRPVEARPSSSGSRISGSTER